MVPKKPLWRCYRINAIPATWTKAVLLERMQKLHESLSVLKIEDIDLFPAVLAHCRDWKVALLYCEELEYFRALNGEEDRMLIDLTGEDDIERGGTWCSVDCHFHDLTPVNDPGDPEDIVADIIAVTGLSGHPWGSWSHSGNRKMWLQHFLPNDLPKNVRIMTFGYNTALTHMNPQGCQLDWLDYQNNFAARIYSARSETEKVAKRPIIFLGHSLGGIMILNMLASRLNEEKTGGDIIDTTHSFIFFGTPHKGLAQTKTLMALVDDADMPEGQRESRKKIIDALTGDSKFLEQLAEDELHITKGRRVLSVYETEGTSVVEKKDGKWGRTGEKEVMVTKESAHVAGTLSMEHQTASFTRDHVQLVKFASPTDEDYRTVVSFLTESLNQIKQHPV
ncbi:hypothetical protein P167DRAFT_566877 [Morchella conica CCBAS932]|uniref:DUF676 domain-containing protein n=1 Tax=Morchella conica CCBAS932 TaxID=1392247 RepID=A0A3N4KL50_9PEZI|nr:hypothetical protein P167DRAFT_566877 [Morchella conica CCBAS932]